MKRIFWVSRFTLEIFLGTIFSFQALAFAASPDEVVAPAPVSAPAESAVETSKESVSLLTPIAISDATGTSAPEDAKTPKEAETPQTEVSVIPAEEPKAVPAEKPAEETAEETAEKPAEDSVTVSAEAWQQMQADMASIKKQIADDKAKAAEKKKADDDKKYRTPQTKLNGVILWDGTLSTMDEGAETALSSQEVNGTKLRQAWIDLTGSAFDMVNYRFTYDASNKTLKDVWWGLYNLPSGVDFKFGHMKEPWSGEELTAVAATLFIEKSYLNDFRGICGSRNNGILMSNWAQADRFSWAAGVFASSMKEDSLNCYGQNGHLAFTTRATYLPFYSENSWGQKFLLHVGGSYSYRHFDESKASDYGTQCNFLSDSQIAPNALKTGLLDGLHDMNVACFELFFMRGAFSVDVEDGFFFMQDDRAGNATVHAGYVQAAYTLTGESRNYKKAGGTYGKLKPKNPFIRTCRDGVGVFNGPGAWEVAYMCSWVDTSELVSGYATAANHAGVYGDSLMNTWGLNWYLNENCRIMLNYSLVHSNYEGFNNKNDNIDGTDGWEHVFGTRFQVTF